MRPPDSGAPSPLIPLCRHLLRQNFGQVPIRYQKIRHGSIIVITFVVVVVSVATSLCFRSLFPPRPGLLSRGGRDGHEEVYLAALEVGVGRDDHELGAAALAGGSRGLSQHVLGISLQDFSGFDGSANLLDTAVRMNDPDHVQGSAWENA